jgi:nucleoside-diphosphate-sugar epimerase
MTSSQPLALITGATGFIGGRLAERLLADGQAGPAEKVVRLLVRDPRRLSAAVSGRAEVVTGSLSDREALARAVRGVSVVYHCAANVHTWDRPQAYTEANVQGVANLLEAISRENPGLSRFVHVSTMDVYGFPVEPCDEEWGLTTCGFACGFPSGFGYGDSKREGEARVREWGQAHGIPYVILRPGNVIGPGSQFISRIGDALRSGLMLKVDGGRAHAGLLHVDNLVDALIWASQNPTAVGQCYNVRDPYDVTWSEFITVFRRALNGKGWVINLPWAVADFAAGGFEAFHRAFLPSTEPLLHRLIVRLSGRTCGHAIHKFQAAGGPLGRVGFEEAMETSVRAYFESRAIPPGQ